MSETATLPTDAAQPATEESAKPALKNGSLLAAAAAAIGASVCCVFPFVLLMAGVGGTWIGTLTAFTPYRPYFIAITVLFLVLAFRKLYLAPESCEVGKACADPAVRRRQRGIFWTVTVALAALIGFPWYGPLLFA